MKRYYIDHFMKCENSEGDWVCFDDASSVIQSLKAELAAEKALADSMERELTDAKETAAAQYKGNLYPENVDGWEMCVNDMLGSIEGGLTTYRKARGL